MTVSMAIFTYINVWCIALFLALPFCIERGPAESSRDYIGAPKRIAWKKIVVIDTIMSLVITATIALVIKTGIVPVHN
jgi:predicted secreted protein